MRMPSEKDVIELNVRGAGESAQATFARARHNKTAIIAFFNFRLLIEINFNITALDYRYQPHWDLTVVQFDY